MKKYIIAVLLFVLFILSCKTSTNDSTSIVLNGNDFTVNGVPVTRIELENTLKEIGARNDSSLVTVQILYGSSRDEMFELKRLLKEANVQNIKEIK